MASSKPHLSTKWLGSQISFDLIIKLPISYMHLKLVSFYRFISRKHMTQNQKGTKNYENIWKFQIYTWSGVINFGTTVWIASVGES